MLVRGIMRAVGLLCVALLGLSQQVSVAEDGCEKFAWPLARERGWFAAPEKPTFSSGDSISAFPGGAFTLKLQAAGEGSFALPPERKSRAEQSFSGMVRLPAPDPAGIYEVTFSHDAWIDMVQDGRYARSVGATGRNDCPGLRKSVRFELDPTPLVLQLSGVPTNAIVVAITRAER
jgi:hypothetical protein